jgi:hypothetical protein
MKALLIALLASAGLAAATPSLAQAYGGHDWGAAQSADWDTGWNSPWTDGGVDRAGLGQARFDREVQQLWQGIRYGLADGSFSRDQAAGFSRELRAIQAHVFWEQRHGAFDRNEAQYRLAGLHQRMHAIRHWRQARFGDDARRYDQGYGQAYGADYGRDDRHGDDRDSPYPRQR